jgi:hypothetical protein
MKRSPLLPKQIAESNIIYLADNSPHYPNPTPREDEKTIVTGVFPAGSDDATIIETIRDRNNPNRLLFLEWENGNVTIHPRILRDGRALVPPDPRSKYFPSLSLAEGLSPCVEIALLQDQIASTISEFVKLSNEHLLVVVSVILASWFPDCFLAAPYLWVVGPLNSGKTTLLKLLWCFCRRGLLAGDLRVASLYKLTDTWNPTLIIDELETGSSGADGDLNRLLRTGSMPGTPAMRNGQPFQTYGLKIISSRQPPSDAALLSRGLVVSMLPADEELTPLDEAATRRIAKEFQAKLLMFRLTKHAAVKNFSFPEHAFPGLSRRIKQIARALSAPLLGDQESTEELFAILRTVDEEERAERFLEPEWLVTFALFDMCHENMFRDGVSVSRPEIHVGVLAERINEKLRREGENISLSARKVGGVLKCLHLRTELLNRSGRGLKFTSALKRKIHDLARQLGIDRRNIAFSGGLDAGNGGLPCPLCEETGLGAGLRFADPEKLPARIPETSKRASLFEKRDAGFEKLDHGETRGN